MTDYRTLLQLLDRAGVEYELHGATVEIISKFTEQPDIRIVFAFKLEDATLYDVSALVET